MQCGGVVLINGVRRDGIKEWRVEGWDLRMEFEGYD